MNNQQLDNQLEWDSTLMNKNCSPILKQIAHHSMPANRVMSAVNSLLRSVMDVAWVGTVPPLEVWLWASKTVCDRLWENEQNLVLSHFMVQCKISNKILFTYK